jgi:two-component system alkaline phosphatase synthesis response regulator PhoP
MQKIIDNIINEFVTFSPTEKSLFTKKEIIDVIKKVAEAVSYPTIESNGIILNPDNNTIQIKDNTSVLPKKEFMLLYYLISNKNKIVRREILLRDIWGNDVIVTDRTIDVHIRKIRKVIGNEYLKTRKCYGYGWVEN